MGINTDSCVMSLVNRSPLSLQTIHKRGGNGEEGGREGQL
jgi:hypothetical protein